MSDTTEPLNEYEIRLIDDGHKHRAIREYRARTGAAIDVAWPLIKSHVKIKRAKKGDGR